MPRHQSKESHTELGEEWRSGEVVSGVGPGSVERHCFADLDPAFFASRRNFACSRYSISLYSSGSLESLLKVSNAFGDLDRDRFLTKKIRDRPFLGSHMRSISTSKSSGWAISERATAMPSLGPLGDPTSPGGATRDLLDSAR
jgi:hypothetical protein